MNERLLRKHLFCLALSDEEVIGNLGVSSINGMMEQTPGWSKVRQGE